MAAHKRISMQRSGARKNGEMAKNNDDGGENIKIAGKHHQNRKLVINQAKMPA